MGDQRNTPRVGFIGFGEAGPLIAKGLLDAGLPGPITAFDIRPRPAVDGVVMARDTAGVLGASNYIFSAVTASEALEVADQAAPYLKPHHLYMDINSCAPQVKQRIAKIVNGTGARFVEIAVMAGVPGLRQTVPMLLCGKAAGEVIAALAPYRVNMRDFGPEYGRAAATKMFRSVLVKGLEALIQESVLGAEAYGVSGEVFSSMDESYPVTDWEGLAHHMLGRTAIHGVRRAHELEEAAETLREIGFEPYMCEAGAKRIAWLGSRGLKEKFGDKAPEDYREVVRDVLPKRPKA